VEDDDSDDAEVWVVSIHVEFPDSLDDR
jgi:hypothetical protein